MKKLRFITAALAVAAVSALSGCMGSRTVMVSAVKTYDFSEMKLVQKEEPYDGQPLAVVETTKGTIKAVLYPEYAPNTVQNFINRANEGYYDGKDIYYIIDGAFFMSGAYDEKRLQGVTEDGELIENECSVDLWTFKGAFCAYNGKPGYGDSRFFVVNNKPLTDEEAEEFRSFTDKDGSLLPKELADCYINGEGIAHFAGCYTVFAQTIEGFDVIEAICASEIDPQTADPKEKLVINKITIEEYHASETEEQGKASE